MHNFFLTKNFAKKYNPKKSNPSFGYIGLIAGIGISYVEYKIFDS